MADRIDTLLIAGPTASGKSAVALALARALNGTIVNADSMQVYRELRILSARPGPDDEAIAPHDLFGHVGVTERYSVARWLEDACAAIAAIHGAGGVAIVTGGTGLYFKALTEGLAAAPASDAAIKAEARARRDAMGAAAFHAELVRRDPDAARLNVDDTQRVMRAWEVVTLSGRGLGDWTRAQVKDDGLVARRLSVVLDVERGALNARIDARFDAMMAAGGLDEARAFWALAPDPLAPAAKALGLPQLRQVLDGASEIGTAVAEAKLKTRRYAKRQGTWFRNQTADWLRLDATAAGSDVLAGEVLRALER